MDSSAVTARIEGIAIAGTTLSTTLFGLAETMRYAHPEMQLAASELSILTSTLEHLHEILITGSPYAKPSFLNGVQEVLKNINSTIKEIQGMVSDKSIFRRLKWGKLGQLRSDIDKHKTTVAIQTSILSAAIVVKTITRSEIDTNDTAPKNRHRIQAESLVRAGQTALRMDPFRRYPEPPSERAPSPPIRTDRQLPGPANQSEVPGHASSEALMADGSFDTVPGTQSSSTLTEGCQSQTFSTSATRHHSGTYVPSYVEDGTPGIDPETLNPFEDDERGRSNHPGGGNFETKNSRLARFCPELCVKGDAATFLYKLVFQDNEQQETVLRRRNYVNHEQSSSDSGWTSEDEQGEGWAAARRRHLSRHRNSGPRTPSDVVDTLLLEWTSLSQREIDGGLPEDAERGITGRQAPAYRWEAPPRPVSRERPTSSIPPAVVHNSQGRPAPEAQSRRRIIHPTPTNMDSFREPNPFSSRVPPGHYPPGPFPQPKSHMPYENFMAPPHLPQPSYPNPTYQAQLPQASSQDSMTRNQFSSSYGPTYQPRDFYGAQPNGGTVPMHNSHAISAAPGKEQKAAKVPFRLPTILVLPQADDADIEDASSLPELDVRFDGTKICRQLDPPVWNSDKVVDIHRMNGKAAMASLTGDKSARHPLGTDLYLTLTAGKDMKIVYTRGNTFGETWFVNEEPVFVQFFHCTYQPQYLAVKDDDATGQEDGYLALGEEWASTEALSQLGLMPKWQKDGRILLDPTVSWSMVREIVMTTLQLKCMQHRRKFTSTFYKSTPTFLKEHREGVVAEPEVEESVVPSETSSVCIEELPTLEPTDRDVNVFDFEVQESKGKEKATAETPAEEELQITTQHQEETAPMNRPKNEGLLDVSHKIDEESGSILSSKTTMSRWSSFLHRNRKGRSVL